MALMRQDKHRKKVFFFHLLHYFDDDYDQCEACECSHIIIIIRRCKHLQLFSTPFDRIDRRRRNEINVSAMPVERTKKAHVVSRRYFK